MQPQPPTQTIATAHLHGPLVIVHNPRAGRRDANALDDALRGCARPYRVLRVERPAQLAARIAEAQAGARSEQGVLVAAGGDGTVNAVAQAALEADLPLGVIPRGTFNYFGRLHGLPLEVDDAVQALTTGRVQPVQVGLVNQRVFLVNASLGLYPKLLEDREHLKRRYGRSKLVAVAAAFATLLRERRRLLLHVEHDGGARVLETSTLFVGNNPLQLEQVGLPEADALHRGQLAAVSVEPVGPLAWLGLLLRSAIGRLGDADPVANFAFRTLDVQPIGRRAARRVKVALDGEIHWMQWPLRFEVSPRPLRLIVPK